MKSNSQYVPPEGFFEKSGYDLCFIQRPKCLGMELHIAGQPKEQVFDDLATGLMTRAMVFGVICCGCDHIHRIVEPCA